MDEQLQRPREKTAVAESDEKRKLVTVGVAVLWLATMLLVIGTVAVRGLF